MTNQTQVSAELSEEQAEAMARAACRAYIGPIVGDETARIVVDRNWDEWTDGVRAAYAASPAPAMAALITEMQADMSGKTVMSEEAFRELHGKAERLSAVEAERDTLRKALERVKAYIGALPGTDDAIEAYEDIRQALTGAPDHE